MAHHRDSSATQKTGEGLKVLVIDDEPLHAESVAESLERVGYESVVATSGKEGARRIEQDDFDVIVTDLKMADLDGLAILRKAREESPDAEVIMITGHGDVKTAVEAIKQGAANYLTKPVDLAELRAIVDRAAERLRLAKANRDLKRQLDAKLASRESSATARPCTRSSRRARRSPRPTPPSSSSARPAPARN
jgi:two-component system response regulator HydG